MSIRKPNRRLSAQRNHRAIEKLESRQLLSATYTPVDLGSLGGSTSIAFAVNSAGQAVGESALADGTLHAALFSGGTVTDLGTLGGTTSKANGINASGVIVGESQNALGLTHAFTYSNGVMTDLGTLGGNSSTATGINDAGEIVGQAQDANGVSSAVVWNNGLITDIGATGSNSSGSYGAGINSSGDVSGYVSLKSGNTQAFRYNHVAKDINYLGTLGGSSSYAYSGINDAGVVAADSALANGTYNVFTYSGPKTTLGNLGGTDIFAYDNNNTGQIVGEANLPGQTSTYHAYVYKSGAFSDLNSQIDPSFGQTLNIAWGINDAGQIAGQTLAGDGSTHAFLLTPIAAPANAGITPTISPVTIPSVYIPGDKAMAKILLTNPDAAVHRGSLSVQLYLSSDATLDGTDIAITPVSPAKIAVSLKSGASSTITTKFTIPGGIVPGAYNLIAKLSPVTTLTSADVSSTPVVSLIPGTAALQFGTVGGRKGVKLVRTLSDGTQISYSLNGPGTGTFTDAGNNQSALSFTGTTVASSFLDVVKGGTNIDTVTSLTTDSALGNITSSRMHLFGNLHIAGDAKGILIAATDGLVQIDGTAPVSLMLGDMLDATITSNAGISRLIANSWGYTRIQAGKLTAPYLTALRMKGNFEPALSLSGIGAPGGAALGVASIGGGVGSNAWVIGGSVSSVSIKGSTELGFSVDAVGAIKTFGVGGSFIGNIAAASISSLQLKGTVSNSNILAGANFGADGILGGGDDTFVAGTITNVSVKGAVNTSVFAAGLNPIDDVLLNGNDTLISGGVIKTASFAGTLSSDSKVLAASEPKKVPVAGAAINPVADERFNLLVSGK